MIGVNRQQRYQCIYIYELVYILEEGLVKEAVWSRKLLVGPEFVQIGIFGRRCGEGVAVWESRLKKCFENLGWLRNVDGDSIV